VKTQSLVVRLIVLGILCLACDAELKNPANQLVIGIESEIKSLDIRSAVDANSYHVVTLLAQGLVEVNDHFLPECDLCERFEIKNGKEYIFYLPPEAKFHDGASLTSEDVKLTFEKTIAERTLSGFSDVERYEAPSPQVFKVILKAPRASFLVSDLALIRIFPKKYLEDPGYGEHPIGSGPYMFEKKQNRDVVLRRFDGYLNNRPLNKRQNPTFERVIVRTIEDSITRYLSLMGGDIDVLLNALSARKIVESQKSNKIQVLRGPGTSYSYLGFNFRLKKFQDRRIRQALAMAIDRESILKHKLLGFSSLANSVVPEGNFFHSESIGQMPYNPEAAKKLLLEAGAKDLSVEIKTSSDRDVASVMLVIKNYWEQIGVKVKIHPAEFATFFSDVQKGNFEIFTLRWTGVVEPDQMYKSFHTKEIPPGKNRGYYSNAMLDPVLTDARFEMNLQKRKAYYERAQKIVAEDLPYISLFYPNNTVVASSRLSDVKIHGTGGWSKIIYAKKDAQ
jgi:peptide/nickel transport system substrate-binding protein